MIVRLILLLALFVIAVFAVTSMLRAAKVVQDAVQSGDTMPDTFQRVAYVLLIVLMFGICTGWLGAV